MGAINDDWLKIKQKFFENKADEDLIALCREMYFCGSTFAHLHMRHISKMSATDMQEAKKLAKELFKDLQSAGETNEE